MIPNIWTAIETVAKSDLESQVRHMETVCVSECVCVTEKFVLSCDEQVSV